MAFFGADLRKYEDALFLLISDLRENFFAHAQSMNGLFGNGQAEGGE